MSEQKYAQYITPMKENKKVNHDPNVVEVYKTCSIPMIYDKWLFNKLPEGWNTPFHLEYFVIYGAGYGWGANDVKGNMGIIENMELKDLPMKHPYDEFFMMAGTDPKNPEDLGGEFELWIGEGKEAEKHIITKTSGIYIPKGLAHGPCIYRRVDRPIILIEGYSSNEWKSTYSEVPLAFKR